MSRILGRLTPGDGIEVSRESLTLITQRNLKELEEFGGFSFEDAAYKYPVQQRARPSSPEMHHARFERRPSVTRYSILISGTGPNGENVSYVRYETQAPAAGQTLLFIDGRRHQMSKVLAQLKGEV